VVCLYFLQYFCDDTQMQSSVFWYTQKPPADRPALTNDYETDVVIVGGGMAGLTCAQELLTGGKRVVLLEAEFCGSGASGKTSGFITPDSEIELSSLVEQHGPEKAKRMWEFVLSGVERIRENIITHHFTCDYAVQDSLFIANSAHKTKYPRREHHARQALDYTSTFYERNTLANIIGSRSYTGAVRYPNTFGINSYLYCQALAAHLITQGAHIFEHSRVQEINAEGVRTSAGYVRAQQIIVCADRFIPDLGVAKQEIYHVQTFLGITRPLDDAQVRTIFPTDRMMVWDTDLVYNYFRITGDNRLLIGGGDVLYTYAHSEAVQVDRFARRLEAYMRKKFPTLTLDELEYVWPGMLGVSKDLLPIMGADPRYGNIWYVGAATGLPWATALGAYAAERLLHDRHEYDADFAWQRTFTIGPRLQRLLTTPATYAISHGMTKYL